MMIHIYNQIANWGIYIISDKNINGVEVKKKLNNESDSVHNSEEEEDDLVKHEDATKHKLDGVGPVDNRPSTYKLPHFVRKN